VLVLWNRLRYFGPRVPEKHRDFPDLKQDRLVEPLRAAFPPESQQHLKIVAFRPLPSLNLSRSLVSVWLLE
jgi:hypothetical protein